MERLFDYQVEDDDKTALIANDDEVIEQMCSWKYIEAGKFSVRNSKVFISVGTVNVPTTYMPVEGCT